MIPLVSAFSVDFIQIDCHTGLPYIRMDYDPSKDEYVDFIVLPDDNDLMVLFKIVVDGTIKYQIVADILSDSLKKELKTVPEIFFSFLVRLNSILGHPDLFLGYDENSLGFPPGMIPILSKYHDMFVNWEDELNRKIVKLNDKQ